MTIKYIDRVFETTASSGTGTVNLDGPITNFQSFALAGNNARVGYMIDEPTKWEIGIGTVLTGSPNQLARTTVLASNNSNAAVNLGAGNTKNVRLLPIASLLMGRDEGLNFTDLMGAAGGTANAHTVAMPVAPLAYTNGAIIMYRATLANTTAGVTVNVTGGNGTGLGAKALKVNGSDPGAGLLAIGTLIVGVFNTATDAFDVISVRPKVDLAADIVGVLPAANGGMSLVFTARVLSGLQTKNNLTDAVNDIDIGTGWATDGVNPPFRLSAATTKQLDAAWVAGNNAGGLFSGTKAPSKKYQICLIRNAANVVDVGFTSVFDATTKIPTDIPAGWFFVCRLGYIVTDATVAPNSAVNLYLQKGDLFILKTPLALAVSVGTARTLVSIPTPPAVETRMRVDSIGAAANQLVIQPTYETDATPGVQGVSPGFSQYHAANVRGFGEYQILVDDTSQIAARISSGSETVGFVVTAWIDRRGKED